MFKFMHNMKIGSKVTVMVALLMVLSLAVVGIISFTGASDALFTSYEQSLTTEAVQTAQILANGMQFLKSSVADAAKSLQSANYNTTQMKNELMVQKEKFGFAYLGYSPSDGNTITPDGNPLDLSAEPGYQQALAGQTALGRPEVLESDGQLYFHAFSPVLGTRNAIRGVFYALIPYDGLYKYVKDVKAGKTGYVVMLDGSGEVAMHPVISKVIDKENTLDLAKGNPKLSALANIVQKCINREIGFGQYTYIDGAVKYMAYAPIPDSSWALLLAVPKAELFTQINDLMVIIIIASVISLAVVMAALIFFVRMQVSLRLKKTAQLAKDLASGNLDSKIDIKSMDEVGQLTHTLDSEVREAFATIRRQRIASDKRFGYNTRFVDKLVVNLERLSNGELFCDIAAEEADSDTAELSELYGRISDTLHQTVDTLKSYIDEISYTLGEIAEANLAVEISSDYKGDFVKLKESLNSIITSFNSTMAKINSSAEQVASGTRQVSEGSQVISQGATEQAASIEELSATITQISEQTGQNAKNAGNANSLAMKAQENAVAGNGQMKEMQRAMEEINVSSENISKIIKVIDDIAFQTNILALNAAVEAARAGIHGKGFAVVAEEVRNLAAKSADAAKETAELIEGSIKKVAAGTKIADNTAASLSEIVSGVEEAARLVGDIAVASEQQAAGIRQVNSGIEQLSSVVQSNSATAQEAAAASEELSSQAELLKAMVGNFRLKDQESVEVEMKVTERPAAAKKKVVLDDGEFGKY